MVQFFTTVLLSGHLIMESWQVVGFLITWWCTDVLKNTGETEGTVADEWQDLTQDFLLGTKTLSVEVGNIKALEVDTYILA